jgi:hypothetical protein
VQAEAHRELMAQAIAREGDAHRAALAGDRVASAAAYREAAERYRASWEAAPPASYGRLVGMLKAAILAGEGREQAGYAQQQLGELDAASPTAAYAQALAALVAGEDERALAWTIHMRGASEPFDRTAAARAALARRDGDAYREALAAIVADFEGRAEHLTGVAIADTALMLELLAEPRGLRVVPRSRLLPPLPA